MRRCEARGFDGDVAPIDASDAGDDDMRCAGFRATAFGAVKDVRGLGERRSGEACGASRFAPPMSEPVMAQDRGLLLTLRGALPLLLLFEFTGVEGGEAAVASRPSATTESFELLAVSTACSSPRSCSSGRSGPEGIKARRFLLDMRRIVPISVTRDGCWLIQACSASDVKFSLFSNWSKYSNSCSLA